MKKSILLTKLVVITVLAFSITLMSCNRKKDAVSASAGATELIVYCADEGHSDKDYFRAANNATSQNMSLSRERALTLAKQRLAGNIETTIKSVTDRYVSEYDVGDRQEFSGKFENLTREVVNQKLRDVAVICEKNFQEANGRYTTYVAIEVNKETLLNGFDSFITSDEKLRVDYNKQQFEKIFNEEMERMARERP